MFGGTLAMVEGTLTMGGWRHVEAHLLAIL